MAEDGLFSVTLTSNFRKDIVEYLKKKDGKLNKAIRSKLKESMEYLRNKMEEFAPERSGTLKQTISSLPISPTKGSNISLTSDGKLEIEIAFLRKKDQQILWVDRGTGIYGPYRRVIRPVSSPFLYFEIDGQLIRTRSVKGQKGQRFIKKAIQASKLIITSKIKSAIKE